MFDEDDMHTDEWFVMYDQNTDFLDYLDDLMGATDPDWEMSLIEPSDEELAEMNMAAELLLLDLIGDQE